MQTQGFPREEDLIPLLICWCLISILAWNVFLSLLNVPWPLSIWRAAGSLFEEPRKDRSGPGRFPRDRHPRRRKSTFGEDRCRERVIYEFRLSVRKPPRMNNDVEEERRGDLILGEVFKDIREFLQENSKTTVEDWQGDRGAFGTVEETTTEASFEVESRMESISSGHSTDGVEAETNAEDAVEEAPVGETNRVQRSIQPEKSLKGAVTFEEAPAILSSGDTDRSKEKFSNDGAAGGGIWDGSRDEREEYAENARDRKNGVDVPRRVRGASSQHKFRTHFEIGEGNPNENLEEYSADSKMKIEERPESRTSRCSVENFAASILRVSDEPEMGSSERSSEKIITSEAGAAEGAVALAGNELTEGKKGTDCEISSLDDESHSERAVDRSAERLSPSREDTEICSRKEGDYLGEQFGILPEKGANCTEERSIMHSGKNATQSREGKKEKGSLGLPPAADSLRNGNETDSTVSLLRPEPISLGKEEEDLNAIIRRMIITEVRRHQKKEQATLKRAYSDTESAIPGKGNSSGNRTGPPNVQGRTFFRDLLELPESPSETPDGKSYCSREDKLDRNVARRDDSANRRADRLNNNVTGNPTSPAEVAGTGDSEIPLERKLHLSRLTDIEEEKPADAGKASATCKQEYASKSTQTEHVYVIRAVRSCPLRKKRLPMQLQLHRLPSDREAVCSKTVHASRDFTEFIFRKASDNLIYEKAKGSCSPSYVPAPERFRWRYLTPNTVA
ncbi:uncharacterized protein LOC143378709 [Andrena cerasifolii]|uniref:uncharacterized protein LOC143378709 n=1 Tax=Andrena cerasifolii TaxID=2819439 RepID=UPI004037F367